MHVTKKSALKIEYNLEKSKENTSKMDNMMKIMNNLRILLKL